MTISLRNSFVDLKQMTRLGKSSVIAVASHGFYPGPVGNGVALSHFFLMKTLGFWVCFQVISDSKDTFLKLAFTHAFL